MAKITITIDENKLEAIRLQGINVEKELDKHVATLYKKVPTTLRNFIDAVEHRKKKTSRKSISKTDEREVKRNDIESGNQHHNTNNTKNNAG